MIEQLFPDDSTDLVDFLQVSELFVFFSFVSYGLLQSIFLEIFLNVLFAWNCQECKKNGHQLKGNESWLRTPERRN
jgi:hypothetical protein